MKITNQSIPPELEPLYDTLVSTNNVGAGAGTQARTRRGSKIAPTKKKKIPDAADLRPAIRTLIAYLKTRTPPPAHIPTVQEVLAEIESGYWNPSYWVACRVVSTRHLRSYPTSINDPDPPPYDYRDPTNLPTRPTYGLGAVSFGVPEYMGSKVAGRFKDTFLTWGDTVFSLANAITHGQDEPAILEYRPDLYISATIRGSRPMMSILLRSWLAPIGSAQLTTTDAPTYQTHPAGQAVTRQPRSNYWRYAFPLTPPPYLNTYQQRRIVQDLHKTATIGTEPAMKRARIVYAPRPMFGRGFNNNNFVDVFAYNVPKIYQIKRTTGTPTGYNPYVAAMVTDAICYLSSTPGQVTNIVTNCPPTLPNHNIVYVIPLAFWMGINSQTASGELAKFTAYIGSNIPVNTANPGAGGTVYNVPFVDFKDPNRAAWPGAFWNGSEWLHLMSPVLGPFVYDCDSQSITTPLGVFSGPTWATLMFQAYDAHFFGPASTIGATLYTDCAGAPHIIEGVYTSNSAKDAGIIPEYC